MENKERQILSEIMDLMTSVRSQLELLDAKMAQLQQLVQQGQLTQQTFVWAQGMANWTPAGQVAELAPLFQGLAPAIAGMPQMI